MNKIYYYLNDSIILNIVNFLCTQTCIGHKQKEIIKKNQFSLIGLIFTISILGLAKCKFIPTYTLSEIVEDFNLYTSRNSEQEL